MVDAEARIEITRRQLLSQVAGTTKSRWSKLSPTPAFPTSKRRRDSRCHGDTIVALRAGVYCHANHCYIGYLTFPHCVGNQETHAAGHPTYLSPMSMLLHESISKSRVDPHMGVLPGPASISVLILVLICEAVVVEYRRRSPSAVEYHASSSRLRRQFHHQIESLKPLLRRKNRRSGVRHYLHLQSRSTAPLER